MRGAVLPIFERQRPDDSRPREAIATLRAWCRGEVQMTDCRSAAFAAHAAARAATATATATATAGVAAARAAGQACAVAHMADHAPHAATYAAKAVHLHAGDAARDAERSWQWTSLTPEVRMVGLPSSQP